MQGVGDECEVGTSSTVWGDSQRLKRDTRKKALFAQHERHSNILLEPSFPRLAQFKLIADSQTHQHDQNFGETQFHLHVYELVAPDDVIPD